MGNKVISLFCTFVLLALLSLSSRSLNHNMLYPTGSASQQVALPELFLTYCSLTHSAVNQFLPRFLECSPFAFSSDSLC